MSSCRIEADVVVILRRICMSLGWSVVGGRGWYVIFLYVQRLGNTPHGFLDVCSMALLVGRPSYEIVFFVVV